MSVATFALQLLDHPANHIVLSVDDIRRVCWGLSGYHNCIIDCYFNEF